MLRSRHIVRCYAELTKGEGLVDTHGHDLGEQSSVIRDLP